jgi:hypothetical protein
MSDGAGLSHFLKLLDEHILATVLMAGFVMRKCASGEGWHEQWVRVPPG